MVEGASTPLRYELEVSLSGREHVHAARPVRVPAHRRRARPPPGRRGPPRAAVREARRARARDRRRRWHELCRLGAERALGQRRRRLRQLGRASAPDAGARRVRCLGALRAGRRARAAVQVRDPHAGRRAPAQGRPRRLRRRAAAAERLRRRPVAARMARRGLARAPPPLAAAARAGLDLRGAPPVLAPEPARGQPAAALRRARRGAGRLRRRHGLHARRAAAGHAPPVLRLVGVPGDGLLRAALDARRSRRPARVRRPPARARPRRDPRLGAGALPARRLGARSLRRHRAVRARRPAPRRASGLGHARLQPGAQRGAELPALERALLAARVPRRRAARGRGRLDALPRLLAGGGPVGTERVRRQRGPRRGLVPEGDERARARARAGDGLGGGGVDGVAWRVAADAPRRARLRLQVEHGLDARHAGLLPARLRVPAASTTTS